MPSVKILQQYVDENQRRVDEYNKVEQAKVDAYNTKAEYWNAAIKDFLALPAPTGSKDNRPAPNTFYYTDPKDGKMYASTMTGKPQEVNLPEGSYSIDQEGKKITITTPSTTAPSRENPHPAPVVTTHVWAGPNPGDKPTPGKEPQLNTFTERQKRILAGDPETPLVADAANTGTVFHEDDPNNLKDRGILARVMGGQL